MSAGSAASSHVLDQDQRLPRGRHGIPREDVVAHQRERMLRATATELRQRGYAGLSVAHVTGAARVSRVTFYNAFEDKLDCVLAAHQAAIADLEKRVRRAYRKQEDWAWGMAAAIEALLDFAAESPDQMHLILFVNGAASEPTIGDFGLAVRERLIAAVDSARGENGSKPSELSKQAAIGAMVAVIGAQLQAAGAQCLPEYRPHLVRLALFPYIGEAEAERIAQAAEPQQA